MAKLLKKQPVTEQYWELYINNYSSVTRHVSCHVYALLWRCV